MSRQDYHTQTDNSAGNAGSLGLSLDLCTLPTTDLWQLIADMRLWPKPWPLMLARRHRVVLGELRRRQPEVAA